MATSIGVEGLHHGGMPIPAASRRGPLIASGGIVGMDPADGTLADGLEAQIGLVFGNIRRVIEAAGGTIDDIVKITFRVGDRSARELINEHWIEMFPDPERRPARHTEAELLAEPLLVHADFFAYVDDQR